jgi:dihydropteroate synthase
MLKYYTKPCNFYFGQDSINKIKSKIAIPLNGNKLISFDEVEILSRKKTKKINIKDIK